MAKSCGATQSGADKFSYPSDGDHRPVAREHRVAIEPVAKRAQALGVDAALQPLAGALVGKYLYAYCHSRGLRV